MNDKQEAIIKKQKREIDSIHQKMKRYLLMQDHMYKDYVALEKKHSEAEKLLLGDLKEARDNLSEAEKRASDFENRINTMSRSSLNDHDKQKLLDLTKENTLLEVNLNKLTRKYQTLVETEKLLRRNYATVESDMADMEKECLGRIGKLKEWKRNAIYQMKILYEQLRVSQPEAEFDAIAKDLQIANQENGDLVKKHADSAE